MAKKASLLPKIEVLILAVFFFTFVVWMVPKCAATKAEYQEAEETEAAEDALLTEPEAEVEDSVTAIPTPANTTVPTPLPRRSKPVPGRPQIEKVTPLYVTLENLNMREEPRVGAKIIDRLGLFDEVVFLNEVTDSTEEINLGKIVANEPWVKIRNKKGQEGWVYGAGVNYYKIKLEVE